MFDRVLNAPLHGVEHHKVKQSRMHHQIFRKKTKRHLLKILCIKRNRNI